MRPTTRPRRAGVMRVVDRRVIKKKNRSVSKPQISLLLLLQVLFVLILPERWRASLLKAFAGSRGRWKKAYRIDYKRSDRSWIHKTLWKEFAIDKNKMIRCWLLKVAIHVRNFHEHKMLMADLDSHVVRWVHRDSRDALLAALEQENWLSDAQKCAVLGYLDDSMFGDFEEECEADRNVAFGRMIHFAWSILEEHSSGEGLIFDALQNQLWSRMSYCVEHLPTTVRLLIDRENWMSFIFKAVEATNVERNRSVLLLYALLRFSSEEDLVTIIVRYSTRIDHMTPFALGSTRIRRGLEQLTYCAVPIAQCMRRQTIAAMITSSPSMIRRVALAIGRPYVLDWPLSANARNIVHSFQMARLMLEQVITDDSRCKHLLGHGFLYCAGYFAKDTTRFTCPLTTFREILRRYPVWAPTFKRITEGGDATNPVANYGRSLRLRVPLPAADYYVFDDDQ